MNSDNYPKIGQLDFMAVLIGGSHLYGLNNAQSDVDYRGVYRTADLAALMGFKRDDCQGVANEEGDDYVYFELARYLQLLRRTNTNSLEILFAPDSAFLACSNEFRAIRNVRDQLVDSEQLLKSCKGYVLSEMRLALGERTGKLGGKRKASLDAHGYSPKNVVQILRIVSATKHFLKTGIYPIKLEDHDPALHQMCMAIKNSPEKFSLDTVRLICNDANDEIVKVKDEVGMKFNLDLAAEIAFEEYQRKFRKD